MNSNVLPKVLVIGQSFNRTSGGGITQSNLFEGWDKSKIAVACNAHLLRNSDNRICEIYYQLGQDEHKWVFPFNIIQKKYFSGLICFDENKNNNLVKTGTDYRLNLIEKFFYPFLKYTGLFHCIKRIKLSEKFCSWLNEYKPDVIYAQGSDRERILFALLLHSYLKIPLIYHVMDDWPSVVSNKGMFKKFWYGRIDRELRNLFERASLLMSISDYMSHEYKKRYGKDFIAFHNPINIGFWKRYQRTDYELDNTPNILYAGRIGLGIDSSLESFAKAILVVNKELNIAVKFIIQAIVKPDWIDKYSCAEYRKPVAYNELPKVFSEADFLLLPYDFSEESIQYIKYSMPTKASEYMVSGTPIIIFAPEVTALVQYAKKSAWARAITENNSHVLTEELKSLFEKKELRQKIAGNAILTAEKNHNSVKVTADFKNLICSVVRES
ncbi:MAG: group 1 glycosyl transferase [Bacteroidetes bacterium GWE2_41_25]|nr:MAG: group 1 glycosyl transferase [Bacteroidetes bacterium GWE2_41_25]OFX96178.1 MAG: group 1 glycosyl transferase [Bacteroidetes bacterium GWC2_40_22]HBH83004.1 group 1 glycosyl transferase [Bacteroidales bacterium]HCU21038.1 group 1 glycosyl transferase [Bacteroidales bacterium]